MLKTAKNSIAAAPLPSAAHGHAALEAVNHPGVEQQHTATIETGPENGRVEGVGAAAVAARQAERQPHAQVRLPAALGQRAVERVAGKQVRLVAELALERQCVHGVGCHTAGGRERLKTDLREPVSKADGRVFVLVA